MGEETLLTREMNLLHSLYNHLVIDKKTPGMFREIYYNGVTNNQWDFDSVAGLEKKSLVSVSKTLIQAGIVCLDLTEQGIKHAEEKAILTEEIKGLLQRITKSFIGAVDDEVTVSLIKNKIGCNIKMDTPFGMHYLFPEMTDEKKATDKYNTLTKK